MEKRKNPEKELRNKSGLFFQIGLLIAMMVCVSAFEYRTKSIAHDPIDLTVMVDETIIPPITIQDPPPPPPKPKLMNPVEVPNDDPLEEIPPEVVIPTDDPIPTPPVVLEEPPVEDAPVGDFTIVEDMPEPDGGIAGFYKYVQKNLKYPPAPRRMGIEGKVFVQFVIDEKGELVEFEILKGIHKDCDNEVLRIMNKAPKWKPGKQRGVPVRVKQVLPIEFRLN
ncbi:energy transducer TonB [Fulvivirga lutimaris]|uniref:energy transducer TonB n=1 Tax=Fulvivirga lutimaris TaxID=1819566 RepID=UPI0012BBDFD4|nr:energy transducer TonB [Fulvivirga lutimaris]MTI38167.1 energy transducer TonB [Fulvivirga lutimaris]